MHYLITGGAGFIGSHIAQQLVKKNGDEVTILDNFSTGKYENIKGLPVSVIEADIRDLEALEEAIKGVDVVFHQAALCSVERSIQNPILSHEVNATGTLKVLEACRRNQVRRLVFASSSSVYGDTEILPKHEKMTPSPLSPYAITKLMGEYYCRNFWENYGLETVVLRYFNVFGPRQDPDSEYAAVIPKFLDALLNGKAPRIYGDGLQTRDFTYVGNIVQANIAAASAFFAPGEIMNVACGNRWILLHLLNCLEQELGMDVAPEFLEPRSGDVRHSQAAIEVAETILGYSPQVSFEDGLKETVAWYVKTLGQQSGEKELKQASGS